MQGKEVKSKDSLASEAGAERMAATIAPYQKALRDKMDRIVATVKTPLKKGAPESNLGNWMADVLYDAAVETYPGRSVAFAVTNRGGIRVDEITAGPLLVGELYELMPFDNQLVLLELSGEEVLALLRHVTDGGGWPVSNQLRVTRDGDALEVTISDVAIDARATYYVATIDYVANGGDKSEMLVDKPHFPSGILYRELLIEHAGRSAGPIDVRSDGSRMQITRRE